MAQPASRRSLRSRAALVVATSFTFASSLTAGAVLHVNLRPAQRLFSSALTRALSGVFTGRVVVEGIEHIDASGVEGARVAVYDPEGRKVLAASGLRARSSLVNIAAKLVAGRDIEIVFPHVRLEHADVLMLPGDDAVPSLARAFTPRSMETARRRSEAPQRVKVWIPDVQIGSVCVRGGLGEKLQLDVDLAAVHGAVLAGTGRTSIRVERYSVSARGLTPGVLQGTSATYVEIPSSTGKPLSVWASLDGFLGDIQVSGRAGIDGSDLDVTADVPRALPDAVRDVFPAWPLRDEASAHVEAKGPITSLAVRGLAQVGPGAADFEGTLALGYAVQTSLSVRARAVDLRSFDADAPMTQLAGSGSVRLRVEEGAVQGSAELATDAFRLGPVMVPPASLTAKLDAGSLSGKATLRDEKLSSDIAYELRSVASSGRALYIDWSGKTPDISRLPWLDALGHGAASWRATGSVKGGALDASVDANIDGFTRPSVSLEHAHLGGTVRGPFARLVVSASMKGQHLQTGPLFFPDVGATMAGPVLHPIVDVTGMGPAARLSAHAAVDLQNAGARLSQVTLSAERDGVALAGKVGEIVVSDDRVDFEGIAIEGAGGPITGSLGLSPSRLRAHLSSPDADLKRLARVVWPGLDVEGHLSFDIDADLDRGVEKGHIRLGLRDGAVAGLSGVEGQLEAASVDRRIVGGVNVRVGELGEVTATALDAELSGSMLRGSSWRSATGKIQIESTLELDKLHRKVPILVGLVSEAKGTIRSRVILAREDIETHRAHAVAATEPPPPDVDFLLWTDGLRLSFAKGAALPYSFQDADVQLGVHMEGESRRSQITARLVDQGGMIAGLTVLGEIPVGDLFATPAQFAAELADVPLTAQLTLPRRDMEAYPAMVRPPDVSGELEGKGRMTGTLRAPVASLSLRGYRIQPTSGALALPFDLDLDTKYDGERVQARLLARRPEGLLLDAATEVSVSVTDLFAPKGERREDFWQASGTARLLNFPLGSLPVLADNGVAGRANGTLTFGGINRDPIVQGQIDLSDVTVDKARFPHGVLSLRVAQEEVLASGKLEGEKGGASVTASTRVAFPSPITPRLDADAPLDLFFEAHDFRAAALYPVLFRGIFSYFDGRLDGTLHLHQEKRDERRAQSVDGAFQLDGGVFQIPQIGQEFSGARARIAVTQSGEVQIQDVSARGITGGLSAAGTMHLHGFGFESAEGSVRIEQRDALPLTFEGVSLGEAWGALDLRAKMDGEKTVAVDVDVPKFRTELPESSSRAVQALAGHPDVRVGVAQEGVMKSLLIGPPQEKRSEDALAWRVTLHLGKDVSLRRGSSMQLSLSGDPLIDVTDEVRVTGSVALRAGNLEIFGKKFEIEHGTVKFAGDDASNPDVTVSARWDAPDETRIYADFAAPLKKLTDDSARVRFRSEPSLPDEKIMSILLYGVDSADTPAQTATTQQQNQGSLYASVGTLASMKVNQALSKVTPGISTRVASDEQNPTPEVAIQLAPNLTAEVSYRSRPPTPGEEPDRVLLTLDWRFRKNWLVGTRVGERGSSVLDLIWQYRY